MSILTRYIARLYLVNIISLLVVVSSLIIAVDVVINLSRFSRRAEQVSGQDAEGIAAAVHHVLLMGLLIFDLWGPRLLQLFTYLNGMVLIAAAGFTCAQLVRHRELVAMLAGGISLHRAARPFILVAVGMIGVQAAVQEFALPAIAHLLPRDPRDSGKRELDAFTVRLAPDSDRRLWYARRFDDAQGILEDPVIWERNEDGRVVRIIAAERARWDGNGWVLEQGLAREPTDPASTGVAAPAPVSISRIDTALDPAHLKVRHLEGFAANLSWAQISSMLQDQSMEPRTRDRLERARWSRVAALISSFVALVGALSMVLIKTPRPMLGPSLKSGAIAIGGFAAIAIASTATIPGLPVWFGAFVPCLVLLSISIAFYTGMDT